MDGDLTTIRLNPYFDTRYSFELDFQFRWFVVNQHPVADVMPVLLKSGQSASREQAVEEMKDCRSMKHPCHRSTVMPEYRLSIFYDRLIKREDQIPRQLLDYIMVEGNKQHRSEELSRAEEAETSYPTSALITTTNSTSIDTSSTTSIDGTTSTSTNITNITSIDDSTLKSIDISSCDPTLDEEKEITMEDFLELEEFLELEDGEKLEDLDSSRKVTMGDFFELEEWLKDMDQNSKKKLDDDQHTSRGDLETSPKASIDRHQPNEIDRQPS
ncbi:hypothetical protein DY000_02031149 [Brassica cretica]|uniref:Uncharacterized protein n=1 Tax=Brassica cretica TaxID=69181 RepID=A0ABQ7DQ32_BRACR|nr:hypothetical protein DY000_02031149 [Brassica cretica]